MTDDPLNKIGSYSVAVKAHEKSVVLGAGLVLYPVGPEHAEAFAEEIRLTIKRAERAAYRKGVRDAQLAMRQALGLTIP